MLSSLPGKQGRGSTLTGTENFFPIGDGSMGGGEDLGPWNNMRTCHSPLLPEGGPGVIFTLNQGKERGRLIRR